MHYPVRVEERERTGELLCEGADLVLREAWSAVDDNVEKRQRLGCTVATLSSPAAPRHVGTGRQQTCVVVLDPSPY